MVGLFNYYRDFIPKYAGLAAPLTNLLRGHKYQCSIKGMWQLVDKEGKTMRATDIKFNWGAAQNKALAQLKAALSSLPMLAYPDFDCPFLLYVDASQQAFTATLHQHLPLAKCTQDKMAAASLTEANNININNMPTHQQKLDSMLKSIMDTIMAGHNRVGYEMQDDILVYVGPHCTACCLCVLFSDLHIFFHKAHNLGGHFGFAKTALCLGSINHPHLSTTLEAYIDNCLTCLCTKLGHCVGELSMDWILSADRPFHTILVDLLLGLLDCEGLDAALVIMDTFLKLMLTAPCSSSIMSSQLFNSLADLILHKGWRPKIIIMDSDKHFIGVTSQRFATSIGAKLCPLAPYHQQANPVECHIQTLQHVLRAFAMESAKDWVDVLPAAELAINLTPSLTMEQTPFDLVYMVQPDPPLLPSVSNVNIEDHLTIAKACLDSAWQTILQHTEENKPWYDVKHKPLHNLHVGDCVFICTNDQPVPGAQRHAKLDPKKVGPFPIKQVLSCHCFKLGLPPNLYSDNLFDTSQLEPAPKEHNLFNRSLDTPITIDSRGDMHFEVEAIVGQQTFRNYVQYCIKWCSDPHTMWEFEEDLLEDGCKAAI
ncbi:uncharacterized protein UHO2_04035 [Ustilago hordei]|uniref:Integrase catalytic domain-containing protein n=1 Tax=Ustilago hordei TaxID=120017 RepID=I2FYC3_USTHO|nr:uncharacterized protein UHO2_04035 [Ustilago hordei]KAJ1579935.1 hypothetical protein NDA15_002710 [Ustilago hordei]KAJ1581962.1 hypothetical protein NDA12_006297 [Ustilago hordei]CCF51916.1 uncharacterized protein UHOR_15200 [Ustilago hordei]SYW86538.1 uncharacterized protein UHO2_04035 [Ustilago hordei]